jgi:hypothetical protein
MSKDSKKSELTKKQIYLDNFHSFGHLYYNKWLQYQLENNNLITDKLDFIRFMINHFEIGSVQSLRRNSLNSCVSKETLKQVTVELYPEIELLYLKQLEKEYSLNQEQLPDTSRAAAEPLPEKEQENKMYTFGNVIENKFNWIKEQTALASVLIAIREDEALEAISNKITDYKLAQIAERNFLFKNDSINLVSFKSSISYVKNEYSNDFTEMNAAKIALNLFLLSVNK